MQSNYNNSPLGDFDWKAAGPGVKPAAKNHTASTPDLNEPDAAIMPTIVTHSKSSGSMITPAARVVPNFTPSSWVAIKYPVHYKRKHFSNERSLDNNFSQTFLKQNSLNAAARHCYPAGGFENMKG